MAIPVAFIGTGIMGGSMAGHLLAAGHPVHVHSRTRAKAEKNRTVNGTFASFASVRRSPTALPSFSGGRASDRMSLKTPKKRS